MISQEFWFSPSKLVMTSLLHFEEKVHRKNQARVEAFPLLMPRLLSQVLEHLGFLEEPHIERRISCPPVLSTKRSLYMPLFIILQQQKVVADDVAEDPPRGEHHVQEVEVEVDTAALALALTDTAGPSYTSQQSPEHIHVSSRELAAVMDAVYALTTTQASLDQRMTRAEVTLTQNHTMLLQIMIHLGLPPISATRDQSAVAASLDMLSAVATASDPPTFTPP